MIVEEEISDSVAYSQGMSAGQSPDFIPCPYESGSRAATVWYEGRADILHANALADRFTLDDGD
jgi:hypothetical protein